jgi:hypothetical protein
VAATVDGDHRPPASVDSPEPGIAGRGDALMELVGGNGAVDRFVPWNRAHLVIGAVLIHHVHRAVTGEIGDPIDDRAGIAEQSRHHEMTDHHAGQRQAIDIDDEVSDLSV